MLLTKELAAKGSAILGSAGAGGTGLYYGGSYLANLPGSQLENLVKAKKGNHIIWDVKKTNKSHVDIDDDINPIKFEDSSNSFEIKVTSKALSNTGEHNYTQNASTASNVNLSCTFKFEVQGNRGNTTTIKDNHKKKIFWQHQSSQKLGVFGLISHPLNQFDNPTTSEDKANKWSSEDVKKVKEKFFQTCRDYNNSSSKNTPISIQFKVEDGGLVPVDLTTFNKWFFLTDAEAAKTYHIVDGSV